MIKYSFKFFIAFLLLGSSSVFAGYIETDLTEDTYITYGGYDWTWASPVNTTTFEGIDPTTAQFVINIFENPSVHAGWMFIEGNELVSLFSQLTLDDFQLNGEIIQSVAYWNSEFIHVDTFDFNNKSGVKSPDGSFFNYFETFYVRTAIVPAVAQVPEPTSLFIFAAGLVGFALRKRNAK